MASDHFRRGGWEVDIRFGLPNGRRYGERVKAPVAGRTAAERWGQGRERYLLVHGPERANMEVPTIECFASRFMDGHVRANRHNLRGAAAKEPTLRMHLVPALGSKRLDGITTEDVQRLKRALQCKAPKTVNNVLTVLNMLLKNAVEWQVIEQMPCSIKLLPTVRRGTTFHDFAEYNRLIRQRGRSAGGLT